MKLYKAIAKQTGWMPPSAEFEVEKYDKLQELAEYLPSGSGVDSGCTIEEENSTCNKIIIHSSFHHMNENGFYCGWSDFTVTVTPDFVNDFKLKIVGRKAIYPAFSDTKEYLYDVFYNALNENIN